MAQPAAESPGALKGAVIGLSASLGEDARELGLDNETLNQVVEALSVALLQRGAGLCFGHDWRPGGIMEAITAEAVSLAATELSAGRPLIQNFVHAETRSEMDPARAAALRGIVEVHELARPPGEELDAGLRVKVALLAMRDRLARQVDRVICLGGKMRGHSGWVPGILEEVLRNLELGHPVFLCGAFGGAGAVLHRAWIEGDAQALSLAAARLDESLAEVEADMGPGSPAHEEVQRLGRQLKRVDPRQVSGSLARDPEQIVRDFLGT